jgi:transcription termination factor Rho
VVADGETTGWFDVGRDGGYVRRATASYLAESGDAFVPMHIMRQLGLRRGDKIDATTGRDQRGRTVVADVVKVNDQDPALAARRPDFATLTASYPERKMTRSRSHRADRLRTARTDRGALARRQDDLPARDHRGRPSQPP